MEKQHILALTLAQFGVSQFPPIEEAGLRDISLITLTTLDDTPEGALWDEIATEVRKKGSQFSPEKRAEMDSAFMRRLEAERHRLTSITVNDVILGWNKNKDNFAKFEDKPTRHFYMQTMNDFLDGLEFLEFPKDEIDQLRQSAIYIA